MKKLPNLTFLTISISNCRIVLLTLLFFSCFTRITLGQDNSNERIFGKITTSDGGPAAFVAIKIKNTTKATLSQQDGTFVIYGVKPGVYTLEVSLLGYHPILKEVTVMAKQAAEVSIQLEASTIGLQEVTINAAAEKFAKKQSDFVARMPLDNLENPQVYTVVPKELFAEQLVVDFREVLMTVPGLSNISIGVGSGGTGLSMRMRGFAGADGAGSIRNGMATNFVSPSDPANLESVEVIKGPSATLFGSTLISYGGLVNRVTKRPHDIQKGEVSFSTGSWGLGRITADYNVPLNKEKTFLFRLNAALHRENSFRDYGVNKTTMIAPAFAYRVSDRFLIDFDFEFFKSDRSTIYIGLGSPGPGVKNINDLNWDFKKSYSSNDITSKAQVFNSFTKATYILSDKWTSQTALSYSNTDNNANYLFLLINTKDSLGRRLMNIPSTFITNQIQQNFIGDFKIGSMRNRLLIGLDFTQLTTTDRRAMLNPFDKVAISSSNVDINIDKYHQALARIARSNNKRFTKTYSAYASDVINLTNQLLVMASLRFDRFDNVGAFQQNALSPKLGVVYQIIREKLSVFGNFMSGYQNVAPSVTEASPYAPVAMKPEKALQFEGGLKFELVKGKLNGTLSYYHIEVKDRVRQVQVKPDATKPAINVSAQDATQLSKGFEADLIANPVAGLHVIFGYAHNYSEYTKAPANIEGKRPYSTPSDVGNLWVSYKVLKGRASGLGFGIGGNMSSDNFWDDANTVTIPGYTKYDATVFYEKSKYRLGLKINNLTNKEYWSSSFWASTEPTKQFIANLSYRF